MDRTAPNASDVCQQIADQFPDEFRTAHNGQANGIDFVNRCAWVLHSLDPRWGLNWKRDGTTLSQDVLAFRVGPTDRHVECFDFIVGAGGSNAHIGWNDITDYATMGTPGTARWAKPNPPAGSPSTPPTQPPGPPSVNWTGAHTALLRAVAQATGGPAGTHDRAFVQRAAEQFAYSQGPDWGMKSTRPGSPLSDNVLAWQPRGGFYGFEIVPLPSGTPKEYNLTTSGQVFVTVAPINHVGDVVVPPVEPPPVPPVPPPGIPPPTPPPVPPPATDAMLVLLLAIQTDVAAVREMLTRGFVIDAKTPLGKVTGDVRLKEKQATL